MSFFPNIFHHHSKSQPSELRKQVDKVFDNWMADWPMVNPFDERSSDFVKPAVDVAETKEHFEIKAELPDMNKDDIHIEVQGNTLIIQGEKKFEKGDKKEKGYHLVERSYGAFKRIIPLPYEITSDESVHANYNNGLLTVTVDKPAKQVENQRKVEIK
ncbi:Hsp20/alpha crystallin family protein [Alteromonas sp. a30]|uniref:Hsp20/alpha crystallin family protein n=1 Tax=Alteromonas sp. a30 TaxID=2730917 RepID=UPI00227DA0C6|nr:Hsp20/alpha crystallin family protein [Alteromonas sp. a30]MCY7295347.1 Hsp20/alpha crystallin family protein [Alteromonas sp. a30]